MGNAVPHVRNRLVVAGERKLVDRFVLRAATAERVLSLRNIVPLSKRDDAERLVSLEWWGVRGDIGREDDELEGWPTYADRRHVTYRFYTEHTPPAPFVKRAAEANPRLDFCLLWQARWVVGLLICERGQVVTEYCLDR